MATNKYNEEKLIHYLISLGLERDDVENVVRDYTRSVERKAYEMGVRHYKRINKMLRKINRELALEDLQKLDEKMSSMLPMEYREEILQYGYNHLPNIQ